MQSLKFQEQARALTSKVLDQFVDRLRQYVVFKLKEKYGEGYVAAAQGRGPPGQMKEVVMQQKAIPDNSDSWDLSTLISIFHDHFDSLFSVDFQASTKAKSMLLGIRDIRNKRAHDKPINSRETYRLADLVQQFFEATPFQEISSQFDTLRLESLELLVYEEKEKFHAPQQYQLVVDQQTIQAVTAHPEVPQIIMAEHVQKQVQPAQKRSPIYYNDQPVMNGAVHDEVMWQTQVHTVDEEFEVISRHR